MEIRITTRSCTDSQRQQHRFHYYLTVDPVESDRLCCENYGVRVCEEAGESCTIPAITTSATRIDELMTLLVEHQVGPAGLPDVVADWL